MIATTGFLQTLAWSLLHFLWQGTAIAAVAAVLMMALRTPARPFSRRYPRNVCFMSSFPYADGAASIRASGEARAGEQRSVFKHT